MGTRYDVSIDRARWLRKNATFAERLLWSRLRGKRFDGLKFRRQAPVGPFIVDFCCLSKRLITELDGVHHADQKQSDTARDVWLGSEGYRVLRLTNEEIMANILAAMDKIKAAISTPP